ncbi:MAG: hypothetical protein EOO91_12850 [Pedobacter sp.]|nr:MAG: hypothetical protein EOO91_12850 [Pedobacter sp.]
MKINSFLFLTSLTLITFLFSCSQNQEKDIKDLMVEKSTICYKSTSESDTAWLRIDTAKSQIIGLLTFNYGNGKLYDGQFKGKMYGDTLKGHFDFKVDKVDKWYRNPVAFLKRDGKLTMGVGKFYMYFGSAYFDDKKKIDYDKGKFIFELRDCK